MHEIATTDINAHVPAAPRRIEKEQVPGVERVTIQRATGALLLRRGAWYRYPGLQMGVPD